MYLLDTNIFLEILLQRGKSGAAKDIFTTVSSTDLFMTDFSLHSIGLFLFQRNRHESYERFIRDIVMRTGIGVISIGPEDVSLLVSASKKFNLDFDDAYQYAVAEKHGLSIVSFDTDFDRTEKKRKVPGQEL